MDGVQEKLNLIVEVMTKGMGKLEAAGDKVEEFSQKVNDSGDDMTGHMDEAEESLNSTSEAADEASGSFMQLTGQGLALLFAGRFLSQTFGGMARKMRDITGVSSMLESAMISVLMPAFESIMPIFTKITEMMINMDEDTKMLVGTIVLLAAALAPVIMVVGQAVAMASAFSIGLAGLAGKVLMATSAFAVFVAGFMVGIKIVEKLGPVIATVIAVIAGLIAIFVGGPIVIAAAVGLIIGIVWGMRDEIVQAVGDIIDWIANLPDTIRENVSDFKEAAKDLGQGIIDGIKNFIDKHGDTITKVIDALIPGVSLSNIVSGVNAGVDAVRGANDFVMQDGVLTKTHPNDAIMATKDPSSLAVGGGSGKTEIIIDRPQLNNEMDVDKMLDRIERRLNRNTGGRGLNR